MNNFGQKLLTMFCGKLVGNDEFGNKYYQSWIKKRDFNRASRWVIYNGDYEPSKVPGNWFSWLHYQTDKAPSSSKKTYKWEIEHKPNLTGTSMAYYPKGHSLGEGNRAKSVGDYESWNPDSQGS